MFKERLVIEYFENLRNEKINYIERELSVDIIPRKAISIVGPRRSGKTYFMLHRFLEDLNSSIYVDLESLEFSRITAEDFLEILALYEARYELKVRNAFIDEIQNLPEWYKLVRTLLNREYNVFITGSSSKLLPKELSTSLRGRTLSYILLPFSFREFLLAKNIRRRKHHSESEIQKIKIMLREYLMHGGFPEVMLSDSKEKILREYFETIFYKDFVERHGVKSINTARVMFEYLFQNFSKEISIEKIKNFIKNQIGITTKTTIYSYIDKISDTLALFFVDKFSRSIYKRKSWPKKVYVCDTGISTVTSFSEDLGKRMENSVFLELLRRTNERPLMEIYYWKDYQGREVDFLVKDGSDVRQLIQVTYASTLDDIERRELTALIKASDMLGCKNLLVITWDLEDEVEVRGKKVKLYPLWKWLIGISG